MLRAHRLDPPGWARLLACAQRGRVRLTLVCHTRRLPERLAAVLGTGRYQLHTDPAVGLPPALATTAQPTVTAPPARPAARRRFPPLPRLPTAHLPHYRADVFRLHPPAVFTRVDALYGHSLDAACRWLATQPVPTDDEVMTEAHPTDEGLQRFLTEPVHDSPSPPHTLAQLRGVQAGFLLHGRWLTIPSLRHLGGPGLSSTPIDAAVVARIRATTASPVLAAALGLTLVTALAPRSLREVRLDGLHLDAAPAEPVLAVPWAGVRDPWRPGDIAILRLERDAPAATTAVFYLPLAVPPLLHATRTFLLTRHPDQPRQRLFASLPSLPARLVDAAARTELTLPTAATELVGAGRFPPAGDACDPRRTIPTDTGRPADRASPLHRQPGSQPPQLRCTGTRSTALGNAGHPYTTTRYA